MRRRSVTRRSAVPAARRLAATSTASHSEMPVNGSLALSAVRPPPEAFAAGATGGVNAAERPAVAAGTVLRPAGGRAVCPVDGPAAWVGVEAAAVAVAVAVGVGVPAEAGVPAGVVPPDPGPPPPPAVPPPPPGPPPGACPTVVGPIWLAPTDWL